MKDVTKAIYQKLSADTSLVNMLATNPPFYDPKGTKAKANSIVPADIVEEAIETPFLVLQEGTEVAIGVKLETESLFIRCYNSKGKSYYEINQILDKVKSILDNSDLTTDSKRVVELQWEATMPGLVDQSLDLKFKEARYRLLVL